MMDEIQEIKIRELIESKEFLEASQLLQNYINKIPNEDTPYYLLGELISHKDGYDQALKYYQKAFSLNPKNEKMLFKICDICDDLEIFEKALPYIQEFYKFSKEEKRHRSYLIKKVLKYCRIYGLKGNFSSFENLLKMSLSVAPDSAILKEKMILALFYLGKLKDAFLFYRYRDVSWKKDIAPEDFKPFILDQDLRGKTIYLLLEQGMGDYIFYLRFANALKERSAKIILHSPTKLAPILMRCGVFDQVIKEETIDLDPGTWAFFIGDLPYVLGVESIKDIPPPLKLDVKEDLLDSVREELKVFGPPPYMGLTWRSGEYETRELDEDSVDTTQHFPQLELLALLKSLKEKFTFVSLQRIPQKGEREQLEKGLGKKILDLSHFNEDLEKMLALLSFIDEYVGVSNTNMHLRASLEKVCRVYLPYLRDMRWVNPELAHAWYPQWKFYRQEQNGAYQSCMKTLREDLRKDYETTSSRERQN